MKSTIKNIFARILIIFSALHNTQIVNAGTISVQHGTLEGTIGLPINLAYEPNFYVVTDPTGTIGIGFQPYATFGGTFLNIQCNGSANLAVNANPGYDNLAFIASSGSAEMNFGLTAGLNLEIIAFGDTLSGSLNVNQLPNNGDLGFYDTTSFSSYLLNTPTTLSSTISPNLVSINTLDALTVWFGVVIPSWLAGINLDINADIGLTQTISGAGISTSAGEIESEGAPVLADVNGGSFQLQNVAETFNDSASLSLGLGADLSADLLWGAVSVTLVNFGNIPLIAANQQYTVSSAPVSTLTFNLPSYSVSASSGSNGKISPSGSTTYYMGQSVTYTATPNSGYAPAGWYLNSSLVQNNGLSYTVTNIQGNDTLTVNFASGGNGPTIENFSVSDITSSGAQANAGVVAGQSQAVLIVKYGPYGNLTSVSAPPLVLKASTNKLGIGPITLSGLPQGTLCQAEMIVSNAQGTVTAVQNFTTLLAGSAPTITGFTIDTTNSYYITVSAGVTPNLQSTIVYIGSGSTSALGAITPSPPFSLPAISTKIGIGPVQISGFAPGTTNYVELVASNALGVVNSGLVAFVTPGLQPTAMTVPPTGVTVTTAVVGGRLNPNGIATWYGVQYWTNGGNLSITPISYAGNGTSNVNVSLELTNLVPGTLYNYELLASNSVATTLGGQQSLTTVALVPAILSITNMAGGSIQITVASPGGQPNILQISTNLVNWVSIATNVGPFVFTDLNAKSCAFYRVASTP